MSGDIGSLARSVHEALLAREATVGVAESLTGGAVGAALTAVPGVSATFRGGVIAYATGLKSDLLGVDGDLLTRVGPVDVTVARQMAQGVRDRLGASYGLATTGVAGPDPQDDRPPGEVHLAVADQDGCTGISLVLAGDRDQVRAEAVRRALQLLLDRATGKPSTDYSVTLLDEALPDRPLSRPTGTVE